MAFLFLSLLLPFLVCCIHLGLLSALCLNLVWVRCLLVSDDDEVALLSKGRPVGPRPGSQSPEREFGYALWQKIISLLFLRVRLGHAGTLAGVVVFRLCKGLPAVAGLPDSMQDHGQFTGYGYDGSLLAALAA